MKATLLFPDKEIVERFYVPLDLHGVPDVLLGARPEEIFRRPRRARSTRPDAAADLERHRVRATAPRSSTSCSRSRSSGVSRTLSHQLVRHRAGVAFDQQSQRYVKYKGAATMLPATIAEGDPALRERYEEQVAGALDLYGELVAAGVPGEDARFVFPNATRTNLVMTTNLRALIHMSGLRLCTMAQWEIRRLFQLIRHEIFSVSPFLGSFLAPKCVPLGYCDEFNNRDEHCPIRPHKDTVLAAWAQKRDAATGCGAGTCRSVTAAGVGAAGMHGDDDPPRVQPHRPRGRDRAASPRRRDRRLSRGRRARVRARRVAWRGGSSSAPAMSCTRRRPSSTGCATRARRRARAARASPDDGAERAGRDAPTLARRRRARPPAGEARVVERAGSGAGCSSEPGDFGSVTFTVTEVELAPGVVRRVARPPGRGARDRRVRGPRDDHGGRRRGDARAAEGDPVLPGRPTGSRTIAALLRYFVCASPGTDPTIDRAPAEAPPGGWTHDATWARRPTPIRPGPPQQRRASRKL